MPDPVAEIRAGEPADLARLVEVSHAADTLFAEHGLLLPPDDPATELAGARWLLVAGSPPVGFAALDVLDGHAHLAQLAVHPAHGRRGTGTALLAAAKNLAVDHGFPALTLTTFAHLPFNGPWYAARGFTELAPSAWGPELRRQVAAERTAGIAVAPRIVMIHALAAPGQARSRNSRNRISPQRT